jgi:nicotinamidase-related amidase
VLARIDCQPEQYAGVGSMERDELITNVTLLGRIATAFELPVVLSTVYVKHGMTGTNQELRDALPGVPEIDRTSMNSWEDPDFRAAVKQTGRKKLILAGRACGLLQSRTRMRQIARLPEPMLRPRARAARGLRAAGEDVTLLVLAIRADARLSSRADNDG